MTARSGGHGALAPSRPAVIATVGLVLAVLAGIAMVAAAAAGGPAAIVLANAGGIARHGAPVAALLSDLTGSLVLGGAVVAGFVLRDPQDRKRALTVLMVAACVWTVAQLASLLIGYAVATGQPIGSPRFGSDLGVYATTDLGAWLLTSLVLAALTTTLAAGASTRRAARVVAVAAAASLAAKAMTGHASGSAGHETATSTILVHLLAVGVWLGGLAMLQLLPARSRDDAAVIRGYSRLALVCWVGLAVSGVWALVVRMNGPQDVLTSAYVQLGLIKAVLLLVLAGAGVLQRRLLAARGRFDAGLYRRLALLELALMGLAVALAAAMSSSPPPADETLVGTSPAEALTDYPLPLAPTVGHVLSAWRPDAFALAAACVLVLAWWWPTAPARPRRRTPALLVGVAGVLVLTSGPLAVYGKVLFSAHLLLHLGLLTMAGPLLGLASGRTLTRPARVPPALRAAVAGALCVALPVVVYATGLLRLTLASHIGHLALLVGSTALGAVLAMAIRTSRWAVAGAAVVLIGAGAVLATGDALAAASWFGATGRPWLADALADQQRAGWALLAWAVLWAVAVLVGGAVARRDAAGTAPRTRRGAAGTTPGRQGGATGSQRDSAAGSSTSTDSATRSRADRSARSTKGS